MGDGKYGTEQYTIDCIHVKLVDAWIDPSIRSLPEVEAAAQKWAADLLAMITLINKDYATRDSVGENNE